MQVRYQAALHAEALHYSLRTRSDREQGAYFLQLPVELLRLFDPGLRQDRQWYGVGHLDVAGLDDAWRRRHTLGLGQLLQPVARTTDGEALLVKQIADAADHQHLVVLVVTPVAPALDRTQLREFLFPVAQHMRLDAAQISHLTDGEVTLGRNGRQGKVHLIRKREGSELTSTCSQRHACSALRQVHMQKKKAAA